jgi:hypothetical protein
MERVAEMLSNPIVAFLLRAAFGSYVIYMARGFYADPLGYFRKWMPQVPEYDLAKRIIRVLACFCIWGGCFIVATAIATQIFKLYGWPLAFALIVLAAVATYLLLPPAASSTQKDESGSDNLRRMK